MVFDFIKAYGLRQLGRYLAVGLFVGLIVLVVIALGTGTDTLMALGLSRTVAGSIVTLLVVAGCLYGLYWFATRMIDW